MLLGVFSLFIYFLLSTLFICLNKNLEVWNFDICSYGPNVLLQRSSLLFAPGAKFFPHALSLCRDARAELLPQCISGDTVIQQLGEDSKDMRQPRSDSHKPLATVPNEFFPHIWPKCFGFCHFVFRGKRKKTINLPSKASAVLWKENSK